MVEKIHLYEAVTKNAEHGYYELDEKYRRTMDDFYRDEYYQKEHALYQHIEYDKIDIVNKTNFYAQKMYIFNKWRSASEARNLSMLDIGTGEGYALKYFNDNGWKVVGVDLSTYGIEAHNPSMKSYLIQGDFYEIINGFEKERRIFDFINADNVLEHLAEPKMFFESVRKVSNDSTIICVTVPNDFSLIQKKAIEMGHVEETFWVTKETSEHFNYFSVDSLCSLGKSEGFEKIIATSDWPIDFFLLNKNTNYKKDSMVGHDCHVACTMLENAIYEKSIEKAVSLFGALADAGIGRDISVYFRQENEDE